MEISGKQMHIRTSAGEIGAYCILPGDPGRCEKIAALLENPRFVSQNREFTVWNGTLEGETVTVCSTGIGGPSAAIAVEELFMCGARTFIRIGTCGGINHKVRSGHLIVATGSVRQEGTTLHYLPVEFPAVADHEVVTALADAASGLGYVRHVGVIQSKDSFYGEHSPERMPVFYELKNKWEAWRRAGVLASEMEAAAVFIVSSVLGARAGAVLLCLWNQELETPGQNGTGDTLPAVKTAVEAARLLILSDRKKNQ